MTYHATGGMRPAVGQSAAAPAYSNANHAAYATGAPARHAAQGGIAHSIAALASLGLLVGVVWWGYEQVRRDVSGVPVVLALDGPMREAPRNPGGEVASYGALAVDRVTAEGGVSGRPEAVRLAPDAVGLGAEDVPGAALFSQTDMPEETVDLAPETAVLPAALAVEEAPREAMALLASPSSTTLLRSPRPSGRPSAPAGNIDASLDAASAIAAQLSDSAVSTGAGTARAAPSRADTDSVPGGTRLVQLGTFDSADEARSAWAALAVQFDDLIGEKDRVLEEASAGGSAFWRLRAMGFSDVADARRFCAALVAGRAECIPVVAR